MEKESLTILSLGGSLIVPGAGIDTDFLRKFRNFILRQIKKGRRFLIVTGGGKTARLYRDAGKKIVGRLTSDDLDWIGVHATRMNAHLLRTIFRKYAHPRLITNPTKKVRLGEPIIIAAGWKPGWSTDYVAAFLAKEYGVKTVINMTNVKAVFNRDPTKYPNAQPLTKISWSQFQKLVGKKWEPGMRVPFDPVASRFAKENKIRAIILDGRYLPNLENFINGRKFEGTVIE
ncbi:MAG: uridylate kinase [Microgenomates group bacterium LiPW_16]|nr:MAG: uridylate kinase [Microgenomates group bacterium LiPW_16]